ncbi:SPFH domain-containing protein [Erysipelothrix sp. HDW6A]|uniref:SPFH domain-containing protein n=1 Tax=Erysipelothrix sp. HDW6A TaxID=2714928 RepID=UPI00140DF694|nr:SPFH domain-containing protein [Erysipelothrix sp. HDW6A]QIK56729.1 SPFH domain-containing protein [Erysipelothrix sp. HDW6A]
MALINIVKYEGESNVFAWKFPNDELSTKSQLIVNESQVAVLFRGGKAYDVFEAGRHTLDTANIPLLNKIVNLPFGGETPFKAEIWYVNMVHTLDIKWGTQTPVSIQDPKYGIYIPISAYGQFGMTINDPKTFLKKMVGTVPNFGREHITKYFRGMYTTHVKDEISTYLIEKKITALDLGAYLTELSDFMKQQMKNEFDMYGIELLNFYVEDISAPEDDEGVIRLKKALSKRAEMDIIGYEYTEERTFDALVGAAENEGSLGGMMGAGVGLGMGGSIGETLGSALNQATDKVLNKDIRTCSNCNQVVGKNDKFCGNCSQMLNDSNLKCTCGSEVKEGQKFCHECGKSLLNECKHCQAPLSQGAKFCQECGKGVENND